MSDETFVAIVIVLDLIFLIWIGTALVRSIGGSM